jgi:hypothetical protein
MKTTKIVNKIKLVEEEIKCPDGYYFLENNESINPETDLAICILESSTWIWIKAALTLNYPKSYYYFARPIKNTINPLDILKKQFIGKKCILKNNENIYIIRDVYPLNNVFLTTVHLAIMPDFAYKNIPLLDLNIIKE